MSSAGWSPLTESERTVALEVLVHGPLSRTDLARRLALSTASLTRLTKPLLDAGLLRENDAEQQSRMGRPSLPLEVVPHAFHFVGINLAAVGTLDAVLINLRAEVIASTTIRLGGVEPAQVAAHIHQLVKSLGGNPDAIGLSLGGYTVDDSVVAYAPFVQWTNVPLGAMVTELTGLPTIVGNDLAALTRAEHWFGAARESSRFAVLTIGAGVGYGLVMHGKLVTSPDMGIGLIGHYPLDPEGPTCDRGHHGCATSMLTESGVSAAASVALGHEVSYEQALELAKDGDVDVLPVVQQSGFAFGRLIAAVANLTMPEQIVLTGEGISLAVVAAESMAAGIAMDRDPLAAPLNLQIQQIDYTEWARGAAVAALQKFLGAA